VARARGFYRQELFAQIAQSGSLQKISGIPAEVKRVFVTAFDVTPQQHLETQAAFQKYTDNSVSKTINLPRESTVEDIRRIYLSAYRLKCKGITVYRYGSKEEQVLSFGYQDRDRLVLQSDLLAVESDFAGGCSAGFCSF
jgi:ribonucleoside-diphosphate reductase alpha chain